jgi:hypothetical protein
MTDPVMPPEGSEEGSFHWLMPSLSRRPLIRMWFDGMWHCGDYQSYPADLARMGWSYMSPAYDRVDLDKAVSETVERACTLVYGWCDSDNMAQRTVDAIRKLKPQ